MPTFYGDRTVPVVYQYSTVPVVYQYNTVPVVYQYNTVPVVYQYSTVPVVYQYSTVPVVYQYSTVPVVYQYSTVPVVYQYSTVPVVYQYSTVPVVCQYNTVPVVYQYSTVPVVYQYSTVPVVYQYSTVPVVCQYNTVPVVYQYSTVPVVYQYSTVPVVYQYSTVPVVYQYRTVPVVYRYWIVSMTRVRPENRWRRNLVEFERTNLNLGPLTVDYLGKGDETVTHHRRLGAAVHRDGADFALDRNDRVRAPVHVNGMVHFGLVDDDVALPLLIVHFPLFPIQLQLRRPIRADLRRRRRGSATRRGRPVVGDRGTRAQGLVLMGLHVRGDFFQATGNFVALVQILEQRGPHIGSGLRLGREVALEELWVHGGWGTGRRGRATGAAAAKTPIGGGAVRHAGQVISPGIPGDSGSVVLLYKHLKLLKRFDPSFSPLNVKRLSVGEKGYATWLHQCCHHEIDQSINQSSDKSINQSNDKWEKIQSINQSINRNRQR